MKTTNYFTLLFFFLSIPALFTACDKDDDSSDIMPPVINLISPTEGDQLKIGSKIHFEAQFSDNVMLSSYKIDIHNADDHTHASYTKATINENGTGSLEGLRSTTVHHHEFLIPEDLSPGNYHFMVYCTDKAGNQSYVVTNVVLSHDAEEHDPGHE